MRTRSRVLLKILCIYVACCATNHSAHRSQHGCTSAGDLRVVIGAPQRQALVQLSSSASLWFTTCLPLRADHFHTMCSSIPDTNLFFMPHMLVNLSSVVQKSDANQVIFSLKHGLLNEWQNHLWLELYYAWNSPIQRDYFPTNECIAGLLMQ